MLRVVVNAIKKGRENPLSTKFVGLIQFTSLKQVKENAKMV